MLSRVRNWSMATKQFLLLFAVTLTIFALLATSSYNRTARLFKSQIVDDAQTIMTRTNQFLDSYLDNGQNILLLISTRMDYLQTSGEQDIAEFLRSIADTNSSIAKTLYIVRNDGKVFSSKQVFYDVLGNPALPLLYEKAKGNFAAMVSQPYDSLLSGRTVAIARPMQNKHDETVGVAIVELDLAKLYEKMAENSNRDQTFVLMSGMNNIVLYDRDTALLPVVADSYPVKPEPTDSFRNELADLPLGTGRYEGPSGPLVAIKSGQNRLGWSLVLFMRESYLYQSLDALLENYRTVGIVMLVLLLVTAFVMSRYFTGPIRLLAHRMDRVRDMAFVPSIPIRRSDEIGRLAGSFNAMMERIQGLLVDATEMERRKKELELKVLQSQIAPHFLYNTLACVASLARQQRIGEVEATIRSLVGVLKFTFDRTLEIVRVEDELDGLLQYMHIQKMRYGDKFRFFCDVPEEALGLSVLKLTLQPIVENAIFHGILPKRRAGHIRIRGGVRHGVLRFVVRDDGAGMNPDTVREVLERRQPAGSRDRFTGIGVHNVHDRIRLHFGGDYGLRIRSVIGAGTVVVITLPAAAYDGGADSDAGRPA